MSGFAEGVCRDEHVRAAPAMALDPISDCHLGELHVLEIAFRPGHAVPAHAHDNARIVFVFSGAVVETYEDRRMLFDADSFSFHPAVAPHRNDNGSESARALIIEPCTAHGRELLSLIGADVMPFVTRAPRLRSTAIELSRALRSNDARRVLLVEAIALDIVARAARLIAERSDPEPRPAFLDAARAAIDLAPASAATLDAIAKTVGVTPRRLAEAFRIHDRTTFRAYVRESRVARARRLLAEDDATIADVALASGFCDQSHLTRTFRAVTGLTPFAWRSQSRTQTVDPF